MEKFESVFESWIEQNKSLYKSCKEYLIKVLNEEETHEIEIDYDSVDYVCVPYDGGNHPEYDSDCFSTVYSVFLKDGDVYLNTEYDSKYEIDRINAECLYYVAESVLATLEERDKNEE